MSRPSPDFALRLAIPLLHACGGSLEEEGRGSLVNGLNGATGSLLMAVDGDQQARHAAAAQCSLSRGGFLNWSGV